MSRADKVAEAIKHEASQIIMQELKDPRIGFVTVTGVDVKDDLRYAKIYVSIMGTDAEKQKTLKGLVAGTGYIRKLLGERLRLRYTPEIAFGLDKSAARSQRISEILEKLKEERGNDVDKEGN